MSRCLRLLSLRGGLWLCYMHGEVEPIERDGFKVCPSRARPSEDSPFAAYRRRYEERTRERGHA